MTNDPNFSYQLSNIGLYANLSPQESNPLIINGAKYTPPSSVSGLHGIPGDFLSPSRFIRAVIFSAAAPKNASAENQVATAFHVLNNFDIPIYGDFIDFLDEIDELIKNLLKYRKIS